VGQREHMVRQGFTRKWTKVLVLSFCVLLVAISARRAKSGGLPRGMRSADISAQATREHARVPCVCWARAAAACRLGVGWERQAIPTACKAGCKYIGRLAEHLGKTKQRSSRAAAARSARPSCTPPSACDRGSCSVAFAVPSQCHSSPFMAGFADLLLLLFKFRVAAKWLLLATTGHRAGRPAASPQLHRPCFPLVPKSTRWLVWAPRRLRFYTYIEFRLHQIHQAARAVKKKRLGGLEPRAQGTRDASTRPSASKRKGERPDDSPREPRAQSCPVHGTHWQQTRAGSATGGQAELCGPLRRVHSFTSVRGAALSGGSAALHPVALMSCPWAQSGSPHRA
jgi:hypothetical protein